MRNLLVVVSALACAIVVGSNNVTPNVLITYAPDAYGRVKQMASAVEVGAKSVGANTKLMDVQLANYKRDILWADAVIIGSAVYNGHASHSLLQFIDSFDFEDDLSNKVGGAFSVGGAVAAGVSEVMDELSRGLKTFGMLTTGGSSWKNLGGTAAVSTSYGLLDSNGEEIRLAKDEGQRISSLAARMKRTSLASSVPTFPLAWKATTHGNLTQPGFFAGDVVVKFAVDCKEGPAKQKMTTIYPDGYTVITRCDKGYQYIVQPGSRGASCDFMDLKPSSCSQCGCPFCVQSTANEWPKEIEWENVGDASTSKITGELTRVWHGKHSAGQGSQQMSLEFATSVDDKPISMVVNSSQWISSVTWFEHFSEAVRDGDFEPPKDATCPQPPAGETRSHRASPQLSSHILSPTDVEDSSTSVLPPSFPPIYKTSLVVNISQPGYDGGNVFINYTVDCSNGPAAQISKTVFGNFHAVLLNCSSGVVHSWDQPPGAPEPFDCKIDGRMVQNFPADVCSTCGLPFSVGSTNGIYTTSSDPSETFQWSGSKDSVSGVEATASSQLVMDVFPINGSLPQGRGTETPEQFLSSIANAYGQTVDQVGWQRTMVHLAPVSTDVTDKDFRLPACFNSGLSQSMASSPIVV